MFTGSTGNPEFEGSEIAAGFGVMRRVMPFWVVRPRAILIVAETACIKVGV